MTDVQKEILEKVRDMLSKHRDIEGMSLEEGFPIIREKQHPLYDDRERYAGTIYSEASEETWYDIERESATDEWWVEHAVDGGRWNRYFCYCISTAAKHPHLPQDWAEWILFMAEQDMKALKQIIKEGCKKEWATKSWPWILYFLHQNTEAVPEKLRVKAKQMAVKWRRLMDEYLDAYMKKCERQNRVRRGKKK